MIISCQPFDRALMFPVAIPPLYQAIHHANHHAPAWQAGVAMIFPQVQMFVEHPEEDCQSAIAWGYQHAEEIVAAARAEMLRPTTWN